MDDTALLILAFCTWGAFCLVFGYLLGVTSKIAPYVRYMKSILKDDAPRTSP